MGSPNLGKLPCPSWISRQTTSSGKSRDLDLKHGLCYYGLVKGCSACQEPSDYWVLHLLKIPERIAINIITSTSLCDCREMSVTPLTPFKLRLLDFVPHMSVPSCPGLECPRADVRNCSDIILASPNGCSGIGIYLPQYEL